MARGRVVYASSQCRSAEPGSIARKPMVSKASETGHFRTVPDKLDGKRLCASRPGWSLRIHRHRGLAAPFASRPSCTDAASSWRRETRTSTRFLLIARRRAVHDKLTAESGLLTAGRWEVGRPRGLQQRTNEITMKSRRIKNLRKTAEARIFEGAEPRQKGTREVQDGCHVAMEQ